MSASRLALLLLALFAAVPEAQGQTVPFGKNKVQYRHFQWHVLGGEHIDVYYYPEEEPIARLALAHAEETFQELARRFRHHPFKRIPLIIYASHQHFEQTNLYPGFIPEGVLGFTEYLKRRVALPFRGDYAQFLQTLRHELVHAFQISKLAEIQALHPGRRRFSPQDVHWWTEGLAEYWSGEQTTEDEMYIRDMVLGGRVPSIPAMTRMAGYFSYPLGAELHRYLARRFGEDYIVRLYEEYWKYDSFDAALAGVLGAELEDVDTDWGRWLQTHYYPQLSERPPAELMAVPLLYARGASVKPTVRKGTTDSPARLYFLSGRSGYTGIYRTTLRTGEGDVELLVEGEKTAEFESLHAFDSKLAVNEQGIIAFVSKFLDRDALFLWSESGERVIGRYQWPDLVALRSPTWAPDGTRIAFEGLSTSGYSDLYILDFSTQQRIRLTADPYRDQEPDWSPDGGTLVFTSDRTVHGESGHTNLYLLDLETGRVRALTHGPWSDRGPRWSPDGARIAFSSDRAGAPDLYVVDRDGRGHRVTAIAGGAFDPDWLPGQEGLVFAGFSEGTFRIYRIAFGEDTATAPRITLAAGAEREDGAGAAVWTADGEASGDAWGWGAGREPAPGLTESRRYESWRQISFDLAGGDALLAPGGGASQGIQFLASDMLGDHVLFGGASAFEARSLSDLLDHLSGSLRYVNLMHRLNFGAGVFRVRGLYRDVARDLFEEEAYGGFLVASYPFTRYRRVELHVGVERSDRREVAHSLTTDGVPAGTDPGDLRRRGIVASNVLSYVKDNTLWLPTGPIDGERYSITLGLITCFTCRVERGIGAGERSRPAAAERYTVAADYRRYIRTSDRSAYAVRAYTFLSDGAIPGLAVLGGPHQLRGYPRHSLAGSRVALLSQEWRFPITDGVHLRLPIGALPVPHLQAAIFGDLGSSWLEGRRPHGAWGSAGIGVRAAIAAPFVLRLDAGRRFRLGSPEHDALAAHRAAGRTFLDVFFGYNY